MSQTETGFAYPRQETSGTGDPLGLGAVGWP